MGPVSGLIAHAIDQHEPRAGDAPRADLLRDPRRHPGRADVGDGGDHPARPHHRARRGHPGRRGASGDPRPRLADRPRRHRDRWRAACPNPCRRRTRSRRGTAEPVWSGGYIASLDMRGHPQNSPGRGRGWLHPGVPLVEGVDVSPTAAYLGLVDTANGIAVREDPRSWMFPNVDLTVHLLPGAGGRMGRVRHDGGVRVRRAGGDQLDALRRRGPGRSCGAVADGAAAHSPGYLTPTCRRASSMTDMTARDDAQRHPLALLLAVGDAARHLGHLELETVGDRAAPLLDDGPVAVGLAQTRRCSARRSRRRSRCCPRCRRSPQSSASWSTASCRSGRGSSGRTRARATRGRRRRCRSAGRWPRPPGVRRAGRRRRRSGRRRGRAARRPPAPGS